MGCEGAQICAARVNDMEVWAVVRVETWDMHAHVHAGMCRVHLSIQLLSLLSVEVGVPLVEKMPEKMPCLWLGEQP